MHFLYVPLFAAAFVVMQVAASPASVGGLDWFTLVERFGFPTVACVVLWRVVSRQSKEQAEDRNNLIARNNDLTTQLIAAVEKGPLCKFEK